jgi:hypothetical protein
LAGHCNKPEIGAIIREISLFWGVSLGGDSRLYPSKIEVLTGGTRVRRRIEVRANKTASAQKSSRRPKHEEISELQIALQLSNWADLVIEDERLSDGGFWSNNVGSQGCELTLA